jgi:predicted hotdog family 3-hydroxylacyl-ACP dehydratase
MKFTDLPPLNELIPHRGDSLFIDRVVEHHETGTTCTINLDGQYWLKRPDGRVPGWLAVEYMAQCMTVHESIRSRVLGHPRESGMLVAVFNLKLYVSYFEPGLALRARSIPLRGGVGLRVFSHSGVIFAEEKRPLAEARLTIALANASPDPGSDDDEPIV